MYYAKMQCILAPGLPRRFRRLAMTGLDLQKTLICLIALRQEIANIPPLNPSSLPYININLIN